MKILLPIRDFVVSDKPFTHARINVGYEKGGLSYSNYKVKPRCFYLSVVPVRVADGFESCILDFGATGRGGGRMVIEEVKRDNKKRVLALLDLVEQQIAAREGRFWDYIASTIDRAQCAPCEETAVPA